MPRLTVKRIAEIAAAHAGLTIEDLYGDGRTNDLVIPRHRAFLAARTLRPDMSYPEIGRRMGGKDHSTVLHGVRRAKERIAGSEEEAAAARELLVLCRAEASTRADLAAEIRVAEALDPHGPIGLDAARWRRVDQLDRAIWLVGGVLEDLRHARDLAGDTTGELFPMRAA